MAIKFNCPHCNKALSVKDESLAGKKAACTGCKKIIVIPKPAAAVAAAEDVEALAAAALTEPKPEAAKVEQSATFQFDCPQCGEPITMRRDLVGKNAPCPECKRIIRVPMPKTKDPADWRNKEDTLPAGARRDTAPAPEGAWEPSRAKGVSAEALAQAGLIPKKKRPGLTRRQKINRGIAIGVVTLLVLVGGLFAYSTWYGNKQDALVEAAVKSAEAKTNEPAAEANRAAGEYFIRAGTRESADRAQKHFAKARDLLQKSPAGPGRDALLADLLVSQVDLGGADSEATKGMRLKWDPTLKELRQTLSHVSTPWGRLHALRQVSRRLLYRGRPTEARNLAPAAGNAGDDGLAYEGPEALAVVGLECYRAGSEEKALVTLATQLATAASQPYAKEADPASRPPLAPSVVALCLVLGQAEPKPSTDKDKAKEDEELYKIGRAAGLALKKEAPPGDLGLTPPGRFHALVMVAEATRDGADVDAAAALLDELNGKGVEPWLVYRLVEVAADGKQADRALRVAEHLSDPGLKGRAHLEVVRARLAGKKEGAGDDVLEGIDDGPLAQALAREALARHNGRYDSSAALKAAEGWEEAVRPFGLLGAILGGQDGKVK